MKSDDINLLLLASEGAKLKYIKANSGILVPQVFAYRLVETLYLTVDGANDYIVV